MKLLLNLVYNEFKRNKGIITAQGETLKKSLMDNEFEDYKIK